MPYAAPTLYPPPIAAAYPTPPPSPLVDHPDLPLEKQKSVFWLPDDPTPAPISEDPYLAAAEPTSTSSSARAIRPPLRHRWSLSQLDSSLRLSPPRGILAVLGGVRVLRIDAAVPNTSRVLDDDEDDNTMGFTAAAMGLSSSADTDVVDALIASEHRAADIAAEVVRINDGVLCLRRAQSESAVQQACTTKTIVPTVTLPAVDESSISVQPPSPESDKKASSSSTSSPRSPRPPARLLSRPARIPPSSPSNINIIPNVLPEVRSPRRTTETLQTRRSRRPRLFGFTVVDDSYSAPNSAHSSPELPSSPTEGVTSSRPTTTHNMLPRRNPIRVRSETSLVNLPHAITPSPKSPRRETGLKLDLGGILPPPSQDLPLNSGVVNSPYHSVIKKKSGEIVKSALKYGGPLTASGTPNTKSPYHGSRSCPTTPSCPKYVHFDAQLERVKLFLHTQKPQVVSRQGSPTDELSEHEADAEDESTKKILTIRLPNFPTSPHDQDADMFLESLFLTDARDALRGVVRVKNLAFEKAVAVRFTFDWWNTTSEVTATYKESIRGGMYDRFQFTIQLGDILESIEEKMLFLCVRYNTAGREIWDSNDGSNYKVLFEKKALVTPKYMPKRATTTAPSGMGKKVNRSGSQWSVTGADADRMADLRAKLNRLTAEDLDKSLAPVKRSMSSSPRSSPRSNTVRLPSANSAGAEMGSLAARYDFGSALKSSRNSSPQMATRNLSDRHAGRDFYSPRPGHFQLPGVGPSSPLPPFAGGPASPGLPESPPVSPAPANGPLSPLAPPSLTFASNNSSSSTSLDSVAATPSDSPSLTMRRLQHDHDVTPSDTADSMNSSSASSTVSESPAGSSPRSPADVFPWSPRAKDRSMDDMSLASYSNFIEQFCWGGGVPAPDPGVRRIHSTSSLGDYLASPPDALTPRAYTPTYGLSRSASSNGTNQSATPNALQRRASPPTREDLEHVDNAIRSLSNSLTSTPISGSPRPTPPLTRMPSASGTILAI